MHRLLLILVCSQITWAQSGVPPEGDFLGINLAAVNAGASQIVFVDAFKQSLPWVSNNFPHDGTFDSGIPIPLDINGYPLEIPYDPDGTGGIPPQVVTSCVFHGLAGRYPGGNYTLFFEGSGTVAVYGDTVERSFTVAGAHSFPVTPGNGGIFVEIVQSLSSQPVQNIRLVMPGHETTYLEQPFYPPFLNRLRGFKVLRFMDPMQTNGGDYPCSNDETPDNCACEKDWTDRPSPTFQTQASGRGVALEYLIQLANHLGVNPWLNIPHGVTPLYLENMAVMVASLLNSDLSVYVELSNELWNTAADFPQTAWALDCGGDLNLSSDPEEARRMFVAMTSAQVFDAFQRAFGGPERVINVLPSALPLPSESSALLNHLEHPGLNPHGVGADVLAVGFYLGVGIADDLVCLGQQGASETVILDLLEEELTQQRPDGCIPGEFHQAASGLLQAHAAIAAGSGIPLITYEAGQHLMESRGLANDPQLGATILLANQNPRMSGIFHQMMDFWQQLTGTGLMVFYNFCQLPSPFFGPFGVVEDLDQTLSEAPKMTALKQRLIQLMTPFWRTSHPLWDEDRDDQITIFDLLLVLDAPHNL